MNDASMETAVIEGDAFNQYKLSWVACFRPLLVAGFLSAVVYLFSLSAIHWVFLAGGSALVFIHLVYQLLFLRSVLLFMNEEGVWVYSGVFPWDKGAGGVRWRDVDDASYVPGFLGWVLKAYTIRIGHRFTRGSEIILRAVKNGNQAVEQINGLHSEYLRSNEGVQ
uniref:hypothetical protein n=1 Tax=Marinobacterium profundum TaxID=1714300 RepID=UPI00082CC9EB|nr:hypothetical protein [Marinobacterium profundum]